jgi:hypothetical protein
MAEVRGVECASPRRENDSSAHRVRAVLTYGDGRVSLMSITFTPLVSVLL